MDKRQTVSTLQSASHFADDAIHLLTMANIDTLVFGSESNNLEELQEIADLPVRVDNLRENLKTGMGFPKAYGLLSSSYMPNDILAIAYLKALKGSDITPLSIQRTSEYHSSEMSGPYASATAIRKAMLKDEDVSAYTVMSADKEHYVTLEMYYPYIRSLLLSLPQPYLNAIFLVDEGIENHLVHQAQLYDNYNDFISHSVTRRYTRSRIQRTLCCLLIQITKDEVRNLPEIDTLQLLGFNQKGRVYLKELKKQEIRIASCFDQIPLPYRRMQYRADVLYSMFFKDQNDFLKKAKDGPVIV